MARQLRRDARGRFSSSGTVRNRRPETAASKPTKATKASAAAAGPAKAVRAPKTTTARGRALTRQREVNRQLKAERKGGGVASVKTARSAAVAARAREYYAATGTGTKRSPTRTRTSASTSGATKAADLVAKPAKGGGKEKVVAGNKQVKTEQSREAQLIRALERVNARASAVHNEPFSKRRSQTDITVNKARKILKEKLLGEKIKRASANYHRNVSASRDRNNSRARRSVEVALMAKDIYDLAYINRQTRGRRGVTVQGLTLRPKRATEPAMPAATKPARTSKAPASAAKTRYRELTSNARRERNNRDATPRTAGEIGRAHV